MEKKFVLIKIGKETHLQTLTQFTANLSMSIIAQMVLIKEKKPEQN